jgi:hypothetical protein
MGLRGSISSRALRIRGAAPQAMSSRSMYLVLVQLNPALRGGNFDPYCVASTLRTPLARCLPHTGLSKLAGVLTDSV